MTKKQLNLTTKLILFSLVALFIQLFSVTTVYALEDDIVKEPLIER